MNAKIQKHLLKAIEKGRLRSINVSNTYQEFIDHGDQPDGSHSHIFYGDLINWLVNSGYEDGRFLAVGPAFEEYERQELDLGKQVELFIQRRRGQNGADSNEGRAKVVDVGDGYVDYLEDALHQSADVISELKQQLGLAPIIQEAGPLHPKERESLLALVAALLRLREKKHDDSDLVGKIALATTQSRKSLSENTVRKYLGEAGSLPSRPDNK